MLDEIDLIAQDTSLKWRLTNIKVLLVVIKDYESAFDSVTLIYIPYIISLADFQPLSIAKINIFH